MENDDYDILFEQLKQEHYDIFLKEWNRVYEKARDKEAARAGIIGGLGFPYIISLANPYIKELLKFFDDEYKMGESISDILMNIPPIREHHLRKMDHKEILRVQTKKILDEVANEEGVFLKDPASSSLDYEVETDIIYITDPKEILSYIAKYYSTLQFIGELQIAVENEKTEEKSKVIEQNTLTKNDKEFTVKRKALAIHYLNQYCKINRMQDTTILADFIAFLTGNNKDNIYKALNGYSRMRTDKGERTLVREHIKNIEFIRPFFDRMGLQEVIKLMDSDLNSLRQI